MGKKIVFGTMLTLLLIGTLILASDIQPVKASGTIYIRSDGSVDPDSAPIWSIDNVTYTFTDNIYDTIVVERSSIIIDGNGYTLQGSGSGFGFSLANQNNVTIKRTKIKGFVYGVAVFYYSFHNTISGNSITQNNECGIWLEYSSSYNTISGNSITQNNECGIVLVEGSFHNTISGNNITNNSYGIFLDMNSDWNSIVGNTIINNSYGIWLPWYSHCNTISGNSITSNGCGIWIPFLSDSNTISGNSITSNGCGIWLESGESNTISGNNITNNGYGIGLGSGSFLNTISWNNITSNGYGIWGELEANLISNTISWNSITSNVYGIWLDTPCSNTISWNSITSNVYGIRLDISYSNTISGNNITNNGYGIWFYYSYGNTIYHNNFVDNTEQVYSDGLTVFVWDDGYPSGGNYWSDYSIRYPTVVDDYYGENQDILGSDGIWDSPYVIDVNKQDNYPFVNPWFLDLIPPVADAGPDQIVHEDTPVILNGEASSDNVGIVSYVWTFTDVNPQTLTGVNPTYTFQTHGIYTVTLNVTDAAGNWATDTVMITVLLDVTSPVADAGPDQTVYEDTLVTLEGWRSTDNVGVVSWTWTFTDVTPQTLTGENVTYTFATPGTYTVTLNVSDAAGNWDIDTVIITVLKMTPEELLERLMETIESWNLGSGTENSLTSKLEDAFHLLDIGNENGAIHKLMDFINQVEALRGRKLAIEQADYLTAEAQRIIDRIKG